MGSRPAPRPTARAPISQPFPLPSPSRSLHAGRFKLAGLVQYLPLPVIGGYLAFVGEWEGACGDSSHDLHSVGSRAWTFSRRRRGHTVRPAPLTSLHAPSPLLPPLHRLVLLHRGRLPGHRAAGRQPRLLGAPAEQRRRSAQAGAGAGHGGPRDAHPEARPEPAGAARPATGHTLPLLWYPAGPWAHPGGGSGRGVGGAAAAGRLGMALLGGVGPLSRPRLSTLQHPLERHARTGAFERSSSCLVALQREGDARLLPRRRRSARSTLACSRALALFCPHFLLFFCSWASLQRSSSSSVSAPAWI